MGVTKNRPKNISPKICYYLRIKFNLVVKKIGQKNGLFFRHFFATYSNLKKEMGVTKNTPKNMSPKICNYLRIKFKLVVKKIGQKICHHFFVFFLPPILI